MNTTTINIRISNILKDQIEELSIENEQSISAITRSIIERYFNNTDDPIDENENIDIIEQNDDLDLIQTLGFTELIFWIYEKRFTPGIGEIDEFYFDLIDIISKIETHPLFPDEIVNEFKKISKELSLYLSDKNHHEFYFINPDNPFSFNYDLFADFFYTIRYDDDGEDKVLFIQ